MISNCISSDFLIEFTCNKFKAFHQIVKTFTQICPPIINISLIKNRLIFTTNTKDESNINQLLYIIYLDNSSKIKISKEPQGPNKTFNLSCTLVKLKPIVVNLFKKCQSPIIWAVSCSKSNWKMSFSSSNIKFDLPIEESQLCSFAFLDNLDTNYLFRMNYPHFEKYYSKRPGVLWFNPLLTKMINGNRPDVNGIFEMVKPNQLIEINSHLFHQVTKASGIRIVNEADLYANCLGMLLNGLLIKYFKQDLINDDWLYMNIIDALDVAKQLTYMLSKNSQGKVEDVSIHMITTIVSFKSFSELLNQREKKDYIALMSYKYKYEKSLSSISNYISNCISEKEMLEQEVRLFSSNRNTDNINRSKTNTSNINLHFRNNGLCSSENNFKHQEIVLNIDDSNKENDVKKMRKKDNDDSSDEGNDLENNNDNNNEFLFNPFD